MLNAREPKIVNGPQILDKYVGESEANVRKLFAEAEEEEKRVSNSPVRQLCLSRVCENQCLMPIEMAGVTFCTVMTYR